MVDKELSPSPGKVGLSPLTSEMLIVKSLRDCWLLVNDPPAQSHYLLCLLKKKTKKKNSQMQI